MSLASKSKNKKSSSSIKSPSASGPSAPTDDCIVAHFEVLSQDVDNRIASVSSSIMNRLDELFINIGDGFPNRSLSAESGVLGLTSPTGQSPPFRHSVSTNVNPIRFQSDAGGLMPHGLGSAHPGNGESSMGIDFNPVSAQQPQASTEAPEAAYCSQTGDRDSARLQASIGQHAFVREPEDEDGQEFVLEFPVVHKTFNRLVNYIYEQYPDSHPHSDPLVPPCCDFESYLFRQNTYLQNKKHTLTCRIKSIRSPAKVGLVVIDLITSLVVSWRGRETPPPSTAVQLSFFAQPRLSKDLSLRGGLPKSSARICLRLVDGLDFLVD